MSKDIIDIEATVTDELMPKDLIKVLQVPEIEFTLLKEFNAQISNKIEQLDLDNIVATADSLREIKAQRTDVRKTLKSFEDSRKMTERTIMKPYKEFESEYNRLVKMPLTIADKQLKDVVDSFEGDLRTTLENDFKRYFDKIKKEKKLGFVEYKDVGQNVQISASTNKLSEEIDDFFVRIEKDLQVIDTSIHKTRVLAEYMKSLDLTDAITKVEDSVKAEAAIQEQNDKSVVQKIHESDRIRKGIKEPEPELHKARFTVTGTKTQLRELVTYMKERGITYE